MANKHGSLSIDSDNLFPIIKKWLYSDHDIFYRELISNGCDAITKLKKLDMMGEYALPNDYKAKIQVIVNPEDKTLKFIDNGLGMTADEVEEYICQIAFSGATDFIEKYKDKSTDDQIIGHFGLGFYSAFMVADEVEIDTLSYKEGSTPVHWTCDGGTDYELNDGTKDTVGTEITLHLNEDCLEFANEYRAREVIEKYCSFMPTEIYLSKANAQTQYETIDAADKLDTDTVVEEIHEEAKMEEKENENGEKEMVEVSPAKDKLKIVKRPVPLNDTNPLWLKNPNDCTDEEYKAFYRKVFLDYKEPLFWIHLNMDYPFNLKGILYFPKINTEYDSIEEVVNKILKENASKTVVNMDQEGVNQTASGINQTQTVVSVTDDVTEVVAEVMPAMVSIINEYVEEYSYFGQVVQEKKSGSGSGIIVGENETELLIATNYHVIEDARSLTVNFNDGSNASAVVKGTDPDMDLAVIAVPLSTLSEDTKSAISIAKLGDSDALQLGQSVIAIGNALGYGQSVSGGYVSALNREIEMEDGSKGTFIQTDAAINPGNSGGALLNIKGEVIGINSSKIGGSVVEGMGFAIPISAAQPILEELMAKETRTELATNQGYIGIRLQTVTEYDSQRYGMPTGIFVYEVMEGLAAEKAGVLRGDIITKFDGTRISTGEQLQNLLKYYNVGEEVEIVVQRNVNGIYEAMTLTIVLGEAPQ